MYRPVYELASFDALEHDAKRVVLVALLEALAAVNVAYLRAQPHTPGLYASGVRYVKEPLGSDNWQDIARTLHLRNGDCEDLCAWRVAELRNQGEGRARFEVRAFDDGGLTVFHVLVMRADGSIEDPSKDLGMNANARA